jgi:hypothetical protein
VAEFRPLARTSGVVVQDLDDEMLVYDRERDIACRLNRTAALVWKSSDGTRTVDDLVAVLAEELGTLADEDMVMIALDNLSQNGLIESGYEARSSNEARITRRRFIRRVGVVGAAAVALPIVHSLVVPPAAAAQSGGGPYPPVYYFKQVKVLSR